MNCVFALEVSCAIIAFIIHVSMFVSVKLVTYVYLDMAKPTVSCIEIALWA